MIFNRRKFKMLGEELNLLRAQSSILLYEKGIINSRKDFGYILNYLGLTGEGAEVGVRKGNFSEHLLETWNGHALYSIDPWRYFAEGGYIDGSNVEQSKQDKIYKEARSKLSRFKSRSVLIRETSLEAARQFTDSSLDFVYLDAQHHYEAVKEDIELWAPKVRPGGVISGDDYTNVEEKDNVFGVKKAVDEYMTEKGLELMLTIDGLYPSWFVVLE